MPITALSQSTIQAVGSASALKNPASVVKELVDNAIDASATSITVEISSNTLDVIQVKDNGHGIAVEDRELVCKASFTSKIRTLDELHELGGRTLGFRGVALASAAESCESLTVTTRVEGEVVAATSKYARDGRLVSSQKASHAVGTTVRIQNFLMHIPVRKQTALAAATQSLTGIRGLLQSYAFARPNLRLSLKILKGKSDKGNWTYGPSPNAQISDVAFQIAGQEVAGQCALWSWSGNRDSQSTKSPSQKDPTESYSLRAFLPKADADFSKVSNRGQYISVDGRPLSTSHGTAKDVVKLFKKYIASASRRKDEAKASIDPFLCVQLSCPSGSYDVNVEPAKDDVLFEDANRVLKLVEDLFLKIYGPLETQKNKQVSRQASKRMENGNEIPFNLLLARNPSTPSQSSDKGAKLPSQVQTDDLEGSHVSDSIRKLNDDVGRPQEMSLAPADGEHEGDEFHSSTRSHRESGPEELDEFFVHSNMYDMDDEEPMFLPDSGDPLLDAPQEDIAEIRSAKVTNPWSIAKLNTTISPHARHPLTPAKSSPERSGQRSGGSGLEESCGPSGLVSPLSQLSETGADLLRFDPVVDRRIGDGEPCGNSPSQSTLPRIGADARTSHCRSSPKQATLLPSFTQVASPKLGRGTTRSQLSHSSGTQLEKGQAGQRSACGNNQTILTAPGIGSGVRKPFLSPIENSRQLGTLSVSPVTNGRMEIPQQLKAGSPQDEFEEIMDFEHRKKAAIAAHRAEVQQRKMTSTPQLNLREEEPYPTPPSRISNSPHQNRYLAAKANLSSPMKDHITKGTSASSRGNEVEQARPPIPPNDPRAYLIRHQGSGDPSASSIAAAQSDLKAQQPKMGKLPLESIPPQDRLHDLQTTSSVPSPLRLRSLCAEVGSADTYILNGTFHPMSWSAYQKDITGWERRIISLVREGYRTNIGGTEVRPTLAVNLAVRFKEHSAIYGR